MNLFIEFNNKDYQDCFRPLQGLTIMNSEIMKMCRAKTLKESFRPLQGLTIMNSY